LEILIESAKQIPALVVLVWLVVTFLKEIRLLRDSWQATFEKLNDTLADTAKQCHGVSNKMVATTERTNNLLDRIEPRLK